MIDLIELESKLSQTNKLRSDIAEGGFTITKIDGTQNSIKGRIRSKVAKLEKLSKALKE